MFGNKFFRAYKEYSITALAGFLLGIILVFAYAFWGSKESNKAPFQLPDQLQDRVLAYSEENKDSQKSSDSISKAETEGLNEEPPSQPDDVPPPDQSSGSDTIEQKGVLSGQIQPFTVLLVGVDNRPGETYESNTDTLIVANMNPTSRRLALLSVPRDTQINFPGHGKQKINSAARLGKGINTTVSVLENMLGQSIKGYIKVNFNGFKKIIDILGGITITVEKDMYYNTGDKTDGIINLKKGTQRLNGTQALQYARFRHDNLADISRTMRQQAVIKALVKEMYQVKTLAKLPWLIPEIYRATETDLSLGQLISLTNVLARSDQVNVVSQTLPGSFAIEGGISYWKIKPGESRNIVRKLFEEGKTTSIFASVDVSNEGEKKVWVKPEDEGDENVALPVLSPDIFGQELP